MLNASKAARHLAKTDAKFAEIIRRAGPPKLELHTCPPFESLVKTIVYQQLSGKAAATIFGRLEKVSGGMTPQAIDRLDDASVRAAGISSQKLRYLRDLTSRSLANQLPYSKFESMADDEILNKLIEVKGIGVWSAQIFLMFALGRPDVLPSGDLGIQKAVKKLYRLRELPKPERLIKMSEPWKPYRTVASWYLWKSIDGDAAV
ncbi:MAG: DNA-3-methyladenine glycosylase family protein [Planctomycetota bacterium]